MGPKLTKQSDLGHYQSIEIDDRRLIYATLIDNLDPSSLYTFSIEGFEHEEFTFKTLPQDLTSTNLTIAIASNLGNDIEVQ